MIVSSSMSVSESVIEYNYVNYGKSNSRKT